MAKAKTRVTIDAHMPPRLYALIQGFEAGSPVVFSLLTRESGDFDRLTIRHRGENDWLVVVKRFGPAGDPEVCFGMGYDFFSAWLGAEGSMANGKWRPDKPYQGK